MWRHAVVCSRPPSEWAGLAAALFGLVPFYTLLMMHGVLCLVPVLTSFQAVHAAAP